MYMKKKPAGNVKYTFCPSTHLGSRWTSEFHDSQGYVVRPCLKTQ